MSLKRAKNERFHSGISAAKKCSSEDDLPKLQHGAERSAFALNIQGDSVRNQAKKGERYRAQYFGLEGSPFIPGPIDMVDE